MIAEVGGMRNVSGRRIATPFAPPRPGSTPMIVPSTIPITATPRLYGVAATEKPSRMFSMPMSVPEPGLERSLRQRDEEPPLEHDEDEERERDGEHDGEHPGVPPDDPHVGARVERARDVEADEGGERDHRRRGDEHLQDADELLAAREAL